MDRKVQVEEFFCDNEESSGEKANLDQENAAIEHEFSSPWDDNDLILVVEDQKLHVHRSILKMTSPVFKAMLSSNFKGKDANEITLPGKKVNEFVDFLRQIYPLLDGEITLKNIKYIYRLADEYQMAKVMKDCRMFLFSVTKTKENTIEMLMLAQDIKAEEARQQCYDVLKKMTLTELESLEGFSELDRQSMQVLVLPRVKRLQECMKRILPEFLGSLDALVYLWCHDENKYKMHGAPSTCPKHRIYSSGSSRNINPNLYKLYERIKCNTCKGMFSQMAMNAKGYISPSKTYLSENIVSILEEIVDLTK
ncbi:speckle-type POZ protein-like [Actinia tenebrosa]|uniref:Speckle-type POZ protein-like n=1 Tax=Actinia tenebrosa TaxID=6105 RepID=A0A6P8IEG7_ACTTE|nr:speckle-type POZ protein-like [Actinia tenebrosa]